MLKLSKRSRLLCVLATFAAVGGVAVLDANPLLAAAKYTCHGPQVSLFKNYNSGAVSNGGKSPGFTTHGKPYCLVWIQTYHWNNGQGATPGTLGLTGSLTNPVSPNKVAPRKATNVPSGSVKNAGWIRNFNTSKPVIIDGHYACQDSSPSTWSQNAQSHGKGFCAVEVMAAKR